MTTEKDEQKADVAELRKAWVLASERAATAMVELATAELARIEREAESGMTTRLEAAQRKWRLARAKARVEASKAELDALRR